MKVPEEKWFILTSKVMKDGLFSSLVEPKVASLLIEMSREERLAAQCGAAPRWKLAPRFIPVF